MDSSSRDEPRLTPALRETLDLLILGRSGPEVQAVLSIAADTLDHRKKELRRIHGAHSTAALICSVWAERYARLERENTRLRRALDEQLERRTANRERRAVVEPE